MNYRVKVSVIIVENKKRRDKNGKPVKQRVFQRRLYFQGKPIVNSADYRIFVKGGIFTVSAVGRIEQSMWTNPSGKIEPWYKPKPDIHYDDGSVERPYERTIDPPMDQEQITKWLAREMGCPNKARQALHEMLTAEPE